MDKINNQEIVTLRIWSPVWEKWHEREMTREKASECMLNSVFYNQSVCYIVKD